MLAARTAGRPAPPAARPGARARAPRRTAAAAIKPPTYANDEAPVMTMGSGGPMGESWGGVGGGGGGAIGSWVKSGDGRWRRRPAVVAAARPRGPSAIYVMRLGGGALARRPPTTAKSAPKPRDGVASRRRGRRYRDTAVAAAPTARHAPPRRRGAP